MAAQQKNVSADLSSSTVTHQHCSTTLTITYVHIIEITRTSIAQGQEGSAILVETY